MIATLQKLPDDPVGHQIKVPLLVLVMMMMRKMRRCQIPQIRVEKEHPLLSRLVKRKGDRQEQLSSWLPLERCRRMHR